jgi:hypothetical protein
VEFADREINRAGTRDFWAVPRVIVWSIYSANFAISGCSSIAIIETCPLLHFCPPGRVVGPGLGVRLVSACFFRLFVLFPSTWRLPFNTVLSVSLSTPALTNSHARVPLTLAPSFVLFTLGQLSRRAPSTVRHLPSWAALRFSFGHRFIFRSAASVFPSASMNSLSLQSREPTTTELRPVDGSQSPRTDENHSGMDVFEQHVWRPPVVTGSFSSQLVAANFPATPPAAKFATNCPISLDGGSETPRTAANRSSTSGTRVNLFEQHFWSPPVVTRSQLAATDVPAPPSTAKFVADSLISWITPRKPAFVIRKKRVAFAEDMGILDQPVIFGGKTLVPTTTSAVVAKIGSSRRAEVDLDGASRETFVQREDLIVREVRPLFLFLHVRNAKELS